MSVDKFGRFSKKGKFGPTGDRGPRGLPGERGPPGEQGVQGIGFKLTSNGDYNLNYKNIKNVKSPQDKEDAVNKIYVDDLADKTVHFSNSYADAKIQLVNNNLTEQIQKISIAQKKEVKELYSIINTTSEKNKVFNQLYTNESIVDIQEKLMRYIDLNLEEMKNALRELINVESLTIKKNTE